MNPFLVLGLDPGASPDLVEATYHRLLRAHHPDLHHGASADELAEAEERTRELNQAMALIRAGWRPHAAAPGGFRYDDRPWAGQNRGPTSTGPNATGANATGPTGPGRDWAPPRGAPVPGPEPTRSGSWSEAFDSDESTDWFGNPTRRRRGPASVPCPLCGEDFDDSVVLRAHLAYAHRLDDGQFPASRSRRQRRDPFRWLRWVPVPQLTLTALLFVYLVVADGLVPSPWTIPALWVGFILYGLAMTKALWRRPAS